MRPFFANFLRFCGNSFEKNITLYIGSVNMVNIVNGEWAVDLDAMTCRNINNKIVIAFEKRGDAVLSMTSYIPENTLKEWPQTHKKNDKIQKATTEAGDVFLRAYFLAA
jgi:hypothetical protein